MEQSSNASLPRDPAPALQRGLALLRLLDQDGPQSLERLVQVTGWPKSSVHRLLQSLELNQAVHRDPQSRRYIAVLRLVHDHPQTHELRRQAQPIMARLAEQTGHTVELYSWRSAAGQLVMDLRCEPDDKQVAVRARVGSHRELSELDATAQIVQAFSLPRSRWHRRQWVWNQGERRQLSRNEVCDHVQHVHKQRYAIDLNVNSHGVRRYAVPLFNADEQLAAVLALAQVCSPNDVKPDVNLARAVREAGEHLTRLTQSFSSP